MIYKLIILNDEGAVEEVINFDVVQNMDESGSSTLPSSPVEEGLVFDHSYSGNTKFSMSAIYTDVGFRKKSQLITYQNGVFVKKYPEETGDDTTVENRVQVMKARIKEIREKGILFGLAECTEHDPNNPDDTSSQINFYYPCGFTDVSFPYKDGGDAIYPSMSIEVLRVTEVQTATVENPSPELIPYVRHGDQGSSSGSSGGVSVSEATGDDVINQIKNDAKAFSGGTTEKLEDSTSKKLTDRLHSERDRQKDAISQMDKVINDLGSGSITKDQSNARHIEIERKLNSSVPYK